MFSKGAEEVFLEVRSYNAAAISLYEKTGFTKISVRKGYYGDCDGIVMMISREKYMLH